MASLLSASTEFKERYAEDVSNESYLYTLYINVLGREANIGGFNNWLGQINNGT